MENVLINVVGFMGVNCSSYMETNARGDSINFVKASCHFRMENMLNNEAKLLIKEAITYSIWKMNILKGYWLKNH